MIRSATAEDWAVIERLLVDASLPLDGARQCDFAIAEVDDAIVACAALERHGAAALLRSVAVDSTRRSQGLGQELVRHLVEVARRQGLESLLLLTTTASEWFPRFGFRRIAREDVPSEALQSAEFRGACPASAVVMALGLRS